MKNFEEKYITGESILVQALNCHLGIPPTCAQIPATLPPIQFPADVYPEGQQVMVHITLVPATHVKDPFSVLGS